MIRRIGPVDVVLFCVKSYDTDSAVALLPPILEPDTAVVSLQNGIDNEARIAAAIGWQHVLGGAAYIFAAVTAPGVVVASGPRSIVFGEWDGETTTQRVRSILETARAGGVGATASADVQVVKWEKYALLAALSAVSAATQLPLGDIRRSPAATTLLRDLMAEVRAVGRASGVALDDDLVDRQHRLVLSQADDSRCVAPDRPARRAPDGDRRPAGRDRPTRARARRPDAADDRGLRDPRAMGDP